MEVTNALLVALMFITILTIGIGNVLGAVAAIFIQDRNPRADAVFVVWIGMLLLLQLSQFWETLTILEKEVWHFGGFLYVIAGPMLLFVASQLVIASPDEGVADFSSVHYKAVERKLFLTLCLVMAWSVGMDPLLGAGFTVNSAWDIGLFVLFGILVVFDNNRVHTLVTFAAVIVMLTLFALRGSGVVA